METAKDGGKRKSEREKMEKVKEKNGEKREEKLE